MKKIILFSLIVTASFSVIAQHDEAQKAMMEKYMKEHGAEGMAKLQEYMSSMTSAETREEYTFPLSADMVVTTYKNGEEKSMPVTYFINTDQETFAFKASHSGEDAMMVYDNQNNAMVIIQEDKKVYMAMNVEAFKSGDFKAKIDAYQGKSGEHNVNCKKSGKTKTINGYECEQMVCMDDERNSKAEIWVTNRIPIDITTAAEGTPWGMYFHNVEGMNGMMMQGNYYEEGELQAKMEVTNINDKAAHTIKLSNYNKMDMFGGR